MRAAAVCLLATALVVVVALGSRAVALRPGSSDGAAIRLPASLIEHLFLLAAPVLLAGIVAIALVLIPALRRRKREEEELVSEPPPVPRWVQALTLAVAVAAIALPVALAVWGSSLDPGDSSGSTPPLTTALPPSPPAALPSNRPSAPVWSWTPVAVLAVAASVLLAGVTVARRGVPIATTPRRSVATALRRTAIDTIEDLGAEPDPRRAVIAAYARMEQDLSFRGLPRRPWEAPLEYLDRALAQLDVSPVAASRLTHLFERAKFAHHHVDGHMKREAIASLEHLAADLSEDG